MTHECERRLVEVAVEDVEVVAEGLAVGDGHRVDLPVGRGHQVAERRLGDVRVAAERHPTRAERVDDQLWDLRSTGRGAALQESGKELD